AAELAAGPRADEGQEDLVMHVELKALAVPVQVHPEAVAAPAGRLGLERAPRAGGAGPDTFRRTRRGRGGTRERPDTGPSGAFPVCQLRRRLVPWRVA